MAHGGAVARERMPGCQVFVLLLVRPKELGLVLKDLRVLKLAARAIW